MVLGWMDCVSTCLPVVIIHLHPVISPCTPLSCPVLHYTAPAPSTPSQPQLHPNVLHMVLVDGSSSAQGGYPKTLPGLPPKSCCEPADPSTAQHRCAGPEGGSQWGGAQEWVLADWGEPTWPQPRAARWGDPGSPTMTPSSNYYMHVTGLYLSPCPLQGWGQTGTDRHLRAPTTPSHRHPHPDALITLSILTCILDTNLSPAAPALSMCWAQPCSLCSLRGFPTFPPLRCFISTQWVLGVQWDLLLPRFPPHCPGWGCWGHPQPQLVCCAEHPPHR